MTNESEGQKEFQKMAENVFKLSTGALALSITFRSSLAPAGTSCRWILSVAWVFLAVATLCYIFFQSNFAMISMTAERFRSQVDSASKEDMPLPSKAEMEVANAEVRRHAANSAKCWKVVYISFLLGIFFLLLFAIINNT